MVGHDLNNFFSAGDIFQLQSDGSFCLVCDCQSPKLDELIQNNGFLLEEVVLLVNSTQMLTNHFRIHPRIDTILEYHLRTIDLVIKDHLHEWENIKRPNGHLVVRLTRDPMLVNFINFTNRPGVLFVQTNSHEALSIDSNGLQDRFRLLADHLISPKKNNADFTVPLVSMDENGELIFKS